MGIQNKFKNYQLKRKTASPRWGQRNFPTAFQKQKLIHPEAIKTAEATNKIRQVVGSSQEYLKGHRHQLVVQAFLKILPILKAKPTPSNRLRAFILNEAKQKENATGYLQVERSLRQYAWLVMRMIQTQRRSCWAVPVLEINSNDLIQQKEQQKQMETPFIKKIRMIMEEPEYEELICWVNDKTAIEIRDEKEFQKRILPLHFRHGKLSSFVRQLNLYGFRKIRSAQHQTFTHQLFRQGKGLESLSVQGKKNQLLAESRPAVETLRLEEGLCLIPDQEKIEDNLHIFENPIEYCTNVGAINYYYTFAPENPTAQMQVTPHLMPYCQYFYPYGWAS